jgi:farnesyl diphosphate synthase
MNFVDYLKTYKQRIENVLQDKLPQTDNILHQAIRYSVLNGGKRLRPILVYATGESLGGNPKALDIPACAIELIHCYSLIHDDLPSMDNDDLRRGKPTCHIAFNEAIAILAGDALQALSFEILSEKSPLFTANQQTQMINTLTKACRNMADGQALDITNQQQLSLEELTIMYQNKTGALIQASIISGALAANCQQQSSLNTLAQYAQSIGLAFQIQDDIIDIESDTKTLGKPSGSDIKANKTTYPSILGIEKSKEKVEQLYEQSLKYLQNLHLENSPLANLAHYIISRKH